MLLVVLLWRGAEFYVPSRVHVRMKSQQVETSLWTSGESQRWLYKFKSERPEASNWGEGHEMG